MGFLKTILEIIISKLLVGLTDFLKKLYKKEEINKEVSEEEDEIKKITDEIKKVQKETGVEDVPKELSDKLRAALLKRNRNISGGL